MAGRHGPSGPDLDQLADYLVKAGIIAATALATSLMAATTAGAVTFTPTGGSDYVLPKNYNPAPGTPGLAPGAAGDPRRRIAPMGRADDLEDILAHHPGRCPAHIDDPLQHSGPPFCRQPCQGYVSASDPPRNG